MSEGTKPVLTLQSRSKTASKTRLLGNGQFVATTEPKQGTIASVYKARDSETGHLFAVKVFETGVGEDAVVEESFRREVQALSKLRHENIVQISSFGSEPSGGHFIALEWVPDSLEDVRRVRRFKGWRDFYETIGRQVLEALAFAHSRSVIHRDIKPSNVLIAAGDVVKVCDFGISKIRGFLAPGVTLAHFASRPFSPPEPDEGEYSYSRDVFGFAATCVVTMAGTAPKTYAQLRTDLESLHLEKEVEDCLSRCLSDEPFDRPRNAAVLLAEIEAMLPSQTVLNRRELISISLTRKVRDLVTFEIALASEASIERFIVEDLEGCVCLDERSGGKDTSQTRAIRLIGNRFVYVAVADWEDSKSLKLVTLLDLPLSELERLRERGMESEYCFLTAGASVDSSGNIDSLFQSLDIFSADQKLANVRSAEQAIYRTWLDLLQAKSDLETSRRKSLGYNGVEIRGATIEFHADQNSDPSVLDDADVKVRCEFDECLVGAVVGVNGNVVRVVPSSRNRIPIDAVPSIGMIDVDTTRSDSAISKQRSALDAVRYGRSTNSELGDQIMHPDTVAVPEPAAVQYITPDLDEDKQRAVCVACSDPSILVVEGPPGTGKTTFISEVVLQQLRRQPTSRILLTSQTHVALDNSIERIERLDPSARVIRIGQEEDIRISNGSKRLLVEKQLPVMRATSLERGRQFIEKWAAAHSVDIGYARMAMALLRRAGIRDRLALVEEAILQLEAAPDPIADGSEIPAADTARLKEERAEKLGALVSEREALERDVLESDAELRAYEADKETLAHLRACSADELRDWADTYAPPTDSAIQLRKILAAHADWEARFGRSREFKAALVASAQIVAGTCLGVMGVPGREEITYDLCIVDEASIATPTEVLVPMSRADRTILVGDTRQLSPFQDPELERLGLLKRYDLTRDDQRRTLFSHLLGNLPPSLVQTLTSQHRMLPEIGNLISHCFYDDKLASIPRRRLADLSAVLSRPVIWKTTSRSKERASRPVGKSQKNDLEVQVVVKTLAALCFGLRHKAKSKRQFSVAVLTGYSPQRTLLNSAIVTKRHEWACFSDIFINVVDAFQGREADIVIFSATRSEVEGLGFLAEEERINVALSRGREQLIIVGDHSFYEKRARQNPLKTVLGYIRANPNDCVLEDALR